jgi:hypothetical protein
MSLPLLFYGAHYWVRAESAGRKGDGPNNHQSRRGARFDPSTRVLTSFAVAQQCRIPNDEVWVQKDMPVDVS